MKNIPLSDIYCPKNPQITLLFRIMRISIFFLFFCAFSLMAKNSHSQNARVTINRTNVQLESILNEIESQTDYLFIYKDDVDVTSRKSIRVNNKSVSEVLLALLSGSSITYKMEGNHIVLTRKETTTLQQQQRISGTVTDEKGEPLIGVTIIIKGSTEGTVTDANGNFSLPANVNDVLQFSYIGYIPQEIILRSLKTVQVLLREDSELLDEVVVIGYGTARKSDLTGSVSSLNGDRLNKQTNPNLSAQLQGQMAGVQVMRTTGDPSSSSEILIHGVTTMSDSSPLIIIDGVPGTLDDVDPSEVQDIQVLKDAASASIYGSRAAAGVILVSTKRAKNNQLKMSYNYEYGIDMPTAMPKYARARDWMIFKNELTYNDGGDDLYGVYSQDFIDSYEANHAIDPDRYPITDWQDVLLKDQSNHQRHSFTLSGGTDKLLTNFSLNYYKGNSIIPGKEYERIYARLNNDFKINNWIHAKVDLNVRLTDREYPNSPIYYTHHSHPLTTDFWSNGLISQGRDGENPYALLTLAGKQKTRGFGFSGKIGIDLTPFEGLTISAVAAPTYYLYKSKDWDTKFDLYDMEGNIYPNSSTTNLREDRNDNNSLTFQLYANYNKAFGQHALNLMVGYEDYAFNWENEGAWRNNYVLSSYPYLNLGPEDQQYNNGSAGHNAYRSYFGRLMYSYANRYLLQVNVRSDGSSRFAKGHRWGTFPSASAGWVVTEEPWLKDNKVLNFLKLRASIGQLGNERIGSEFPYQAKLAFGTGYLPNTSTGVSDVVQTAYQSEYAFDDLTWETTTTYGVGVDFGLLDSRLRGSFDYYYKKTTDMLMQVGFPSYFGYNAPQNNAADMHTRGWDFELSWSDHIDDFKYGVSFNLSDYRSKMGYMADRQNIGSGKITEEGSYYNEWYGYKSLGIILNADAMYDADGKKIAVLTNNDKEGNIRYQDIDGDNKITASSDRVRLGNSLPELQYGGSIWAEWKGIDFNLAFQGIGHILSYWSWPVTPFKYQAYACPLNLIESHWSPNATDAENAKAKYPKLTTNDTNIYATSDFYLFNGAYMRIKNITLGYTFPKQLTQKFNVSKLRAYFSVNDLPAFSNHPKGYDPEWTSYGNDLITSSFIFGLNVSF